jgi:tetratricopeptide (TPR) repeat protein
LLEAEEAYCIGNFEGAKTSYDSAIVSARAHRFLSEEALGYELAGYFYLEVGQKESAMDYFLMAHERYHQWGALEKVNKLYEFVQMSFSAVLPPSGIERGASTASIDSHTSNADSRKRGTPL